MAQHSTCMHKKLLHFSLRLRCIRQIGIEQSQRFSVTDSELTAAFIKIVFCNFCCCSSCRLHNIFKTSPCISQLFNQFATGNFLATRFWWCVPDFLYNVYEHVKLYMNPRLFMPCPIHM